MNIKERYNQANALRRKLVSLGDEVEKMINGLTKEQQEEYEMLRSVERYIAGGYIGLYGLALKLDKQMEAEAQ